MARTTTNLTNTTFRPTERTLGPFNMPEATKFLGIGVNRDGWTSADQSITLRAETSLDGTTWSLWFEFTCLGGQIIDPKTGTASVQSYVAPPTRPPAGSLVRAKVRTNGVSIQRALVLIEDDFDGSRLR
jgi:hypothetical protein